MKVLEIESSNNQKLKLIRSLSESVRKKSDHNNLILIEGPKLIQEALKNGIKLEDVVVSRSYLQNSFAKTDLEKELESIIVVKDSLFKGLYTTDTSCGIIATGVPRNHDLNSILSHCKTILLTDDVQDPGNLGTIIRTAYAFSVDALILSKGTVDCYNPKVIRSSMGAIFALPIFPAVDLKSIIVDLKTKGIHVLALDGKAKQTIWKQPVSKPAAYVLGNEGHGISPEILNLVDIIISIPINPNCESLNVAIAAAIILVRDKVK